MATEATELRVMDALEAELEKIGTAPLSSWLTQSPPAIRMGTLPGDPPATGSVPYEQLWVQHVTTTPKDGEDGPAAHMATLTVQVWCVSTRSDGWRRIVQLKRDVLYALFTAEQTFYNNFPYGLWPGAWRISDELSRAGVAVGVQEITADIRMEHSNP